MLMQVGAETAGDGLADLRSRDADAAASERIGAERRDGDAARLLAVEEGLDLPVPFHAIGEASPARALARAEDRADQRENAGRLHEQPVLLKFETLAIELLELAVEIIADERDSEVARVASTTWTPNERSASSSSLSPPTPSVSIWTRYLLEIFRSHIGPQAKTCPIGRREIVGSCPPR